MKSIAALATAVAVSGTALASPLFGVASFDGQDLYGYTVSNELYNINQITGEATLLRNATGITPEGDLAFDGAGSLLTAGIGEIASIDPMSGSPSPIATTNGFYDFSGLSFDGAGALFGYASDEINGDALYQIDLGGAGASLVGLTGTAGLPNVGGLDYAMGQLFLSDGSSLYSVDTASGAASLIGAHGVGGFSGIAFVPAPGAAALLAGAAVLLRRRRA